MLDRFERLEIQGTIETKLCERCDCSGCTKYTLEEVATCKRLKLMDIIDVVYNKGVDDGKHLVAEALNEKVFALLEEVIE